jgi:hypothetical protein
VFKKEIKTPRYGKEKLETNGKTAKPGQSFKIELLFSNSL